MDMTRTEAEPQFSYPLRQFALMFIVLLLVGFGATIIYPTVRPVIIANPFLNGVIGVVFVVGLVACFWQILQLRNSVKWLEDFALEREGASVDRAPRLLVSLATLLRTRGARSQISASSSRSILDSVATRIEELRDITRYIVNLLIFLGLLGTFYGLATTVPAVVETIRSLAPKEGEGGVEVFSRLMSGLEAQLGGMGTAFGSSLLGLAGSLIVGLLELFVSHGQNRFYRELEDWLSTITRVGFASGESDGAGDMGPVAGILDHMAEQMEAMRQMYTQSDVSRAMLEERMGGVMESLTGLSDKMQSTGETAAALGRVAEGQEQLIALLTSKSTEGSMADDAETRMRLRSIDTQMLHILEELAAGRQESIGDLRADIGALTKVIRQATQPRGRPGG